MERVLKLLGMRYAIAALVLVGVAALYGAASFSRPGSAEAKGHTEPVDAAVMVCPGHEGGRVGIRSLPQKRTGGRLDVAPTRGGSPLASMTAPGQGWDKDMGTTKDSFTVRASGALAAGLEAEQTTHWGGGDDRGLANARCARPGTDLWFLGPGPLAADRLDLYLTNVDAQPASVDVTALSGEGPLDTTEGRATPVAPYATSVIKIGEQPEGLGDIVKTARDLALNVHATGGRVAASLRVRIGAKKGIEWLPLSPGPATSLVVPGVPGGDGQRRLLVAVPGEADARIKVRAVTADGAFAPQGQDTVEAPAQSVTSIDLAGSLSGRAAAVRLDSDQPVIAGFAALRGADAAYGTATDPLGGASGASAVVADDRYDASVVLTAPAGRAGVQITTMDAQGAGAPQDVEIGAGRTVETRLAAPRGGDKGYGAVITVKPGSGPVYGARIMAKGKGDGYLFTVLPLMPAPTMLRLPPAGDSQTALIP
ncbi:DUF5719 family protein [Actinomadura violacea]|uniref:Secreted protein n=1 Tax=Actinomadura violacea TaxID=2819934 RepID=A0ABS3RJN9_9ACTN|nr:DUF5719 family protein [Actinomadura violacea]MBO2456801.1 hypothetical protein [Actinomadura violacea]